jgi:hypothetical protein
MTKNPGYNFFGLGSPGSKADDVKKPVREGSHEGTREGAEQGVIDGFQKMMFDGNGGAGNSSGNIIKASYTTSDTGSGDGTSTVGGNRFTSLSPSIGGTAIGPSGIGSGPGRYNFMHGQYGGAGQNQVKVTAGGKTFTVNAASAPYLKGFVDEIAAAGAPINSVGGLSIRNIAGTGHLSQHAYGNAIDIDQHSRNVVDRGFAVWAKTHPDQLRAALDRWGIINGGDWKNPDFGHFEWGGTSGVAGTRGAPKASSDVNINQPILLDGRVIAKNTVKNITKMGQGPSSGPRLPDYSVTRPISI